MKILWFDTETTGLNAYHNDIISLACLVEIDGELKEELYLEIQPINWESIQTKALEVNGYTREQLRGFMKPVDAVKKLNNFLGKYCDKFDKADKFIPAGHNVIKFDVPFLEGLYKKVGDKFLYSWLDYHILDTVPLALAQKIFKKLDTPNVKLETLANHFNIQINAHNALSDIKATRSVFYALHEKDLTNA